MRRKFAWNYIREGWKVRQAWTLQVRKWKRNRRHYRWKFVLSFHIQSNGQRGLSQCKHLLASRWEIDAHWSWLTFPKEHHQDQSCLCWSTCMAGRFILERTTLIESEVETLPGIGNLEHIIFALFEVSFAKDRFAETVPCNQTVSRCCNLFQEQIFSFSRPWTYFYNLRRSSGCGAKYYRSWAKLPFTWLRILDSWWAWRRWISCKLGHIR